MIKNFFKNKRVLITGHTGFKGSWLTLMLSSYGAKIYGYALNPISRPNFFDGLKLSKYLVKDYRENILDLNKLKSVIKKNKPEIIFQCILNITKLHTLIVYYQTNNLPQLIHHKSINRNYIFRYNILY